MAENRGVFRFYIIDPPCPCALGATMGATHRVRLSQSLLYAAIVAKHADLAGVGDISIEGRVLSKAAEAQWSLRARRCRSEMAIRCRVGTEAASHCAPFLTAANVDCCRASVPHPEQGAMSARHIDVG